MRVFAETRRIPLSQAAAYCGFSPRTFEGYCQTGKGPPYIQPTGPRGRKVFDTADLDEWLAKGRRQSTSETIAA